MTVVRFRTFCVDVKIVAPTEGAAEDFELEVKRKIQRAVNTQSVAKRHGVLVSPPGAYIHKPKDSDFSVFLSATPASRR
jgi:hypothetical protein